MFLQDLLKKLNDKMKNIKLNEIVEFLIANKKELLIFTVSFIVMVIMVTLLMSRCENGDRAVEKAVSDNTPVKNRIGGIALPSELSEDKLFLLQGALYYPDLTTDDLTNDYQELYPLNKCNRPDMRWIDREIDRVIDKSIVESTSFNFEKRRTE